MDFKLFKKKKKFKLGAIAMTVAFLFSNVQAFAMPITTTGHISYLNYRTLDSGVLPIGGREYHLNNGTVAYCLDTTADHPTGQDYTKEISNNSGEEAILYWGYPAMNGSKFGLDEHRWRYATQMALWCYEREAHLNRGVDINRLQSGDEPLSRFKPAIEYLLNKGLSKSMPNFLSVSGNNVSAVNDGSYFVSQPITVQSDYSQPIHAQAVGQYASSIKIVNMNGSAQTTFKAGDRFRIEVPNNLPSGSAKVVLSNSLSLPGLVTMKAPEGRLQNMAVVKMNTNAPHHQTITVNWKGLNGSFELTKTNANGQPLTGAKFTLKDSNGHVVGTKTTENGKLSFTNIPEGTYTLIEDSAPAGYVTVGNQTVVIKADQTTKLTLVDKQAKGNFELTKNNANGQPLTGAKFTLKDSKGNVVGTKTTENGKLSFNNLPVGTYTLTEDSAPAGYVTVGPQTVVITNNNTTKLTLVDGVAKGKVAVTKVDDQSGAKLAGAVFTIYNKDGKSVSTITTDGNGYGESSALPYGDYTMKETKAPTGYLLNGKTYPVNVSSNGQVIKVTAKDTEIKGYIQVTKVDEASKAPLKDAEFGIFKDGKQVSTMKTNAQGVATSGLLPYGHYVVKELKAPNKYVLNGKEFPVTISENGATVKLTVSDKLIRGSVKLVKVDADTQRPLQGAKFDLYYGNTKIGTYTTDANGEITVNNLEAGDYTWKEVAAPTNYNVSTSNYTFAISKDGQVANVKATDKVQTGTVDFTKTDVTTGKVIDGAKIEITGLDVQNKQIKIDFTSSSKGNHFTLPVGKYQFKETVAPTGYNLNTTVGTFTIANGKVTKANIKDARQQGELDFTKTDVTTGKNIAGAKVQITCVEGLDKGKTIEFTSSLEGNKFTLDAGKYTYKEISAPAGYLVNTAVGTFTIENGKVTKANIKDSRQQGKLVFTKTDVTNGKVVEGAKIKITCTSGLSKGQVIDFTSSAKGNEFTLDAGTYTFEETSAPKGYLLNKTVGTFTISNGKVTKANISDKRKEGKLIFTKTDVTTGKVIDGAKIQITCMSGLDKGKVINFVSSAKGNEFTLSDGQYQFKETVAPKGYKLSTEVGTFTIENGKVTKANLKDARQVGELDFTKTDITNGKVIEGAKIKITCTEGLDKGKVIEFTSSKDGNRFKLDAGTYTFEETVAPKGYLVNKTVGTFVIKDGQVTKANIKDSRKQGELDFTKTDVTNSKVVAGAKIKIVCTSGLSKGKVIEFTSSATGNHFKLDEGTYTFSEVSAPKGYLVNTAVGTFTIENGKVTKANISDKRKMGELDFTKTDVTNSKVIAGAKIEITCVEGLDKGKTISFTSSAEGNHFKLAEGKYTFKEVSAPKGYLVNTTVGTFTIENNKITKANIKDARAMGELDFTKTDVTNSKVVAGAKIKITCIEGLDKGKVIEFTSSAEGNHFKLDEGKYTFEEISAPKGYLINKAVGTFTIENGKLTKANISDQRVPEAKIVKTGSAFDVNGLAPIGGIFLIAGLASLAFVALRRRK